jgi:hypothetical protein
MMMMMMMMMINDNLMARGIFLKVLGYVAGEAIPCFYYLTGSFITVFTTAPLRWTVL